MWPNDCPYMVGPPETALTKDVYSDVVYSVPRGEPCFMWFRQKECIVFSDTIYFERTAILPFHQLGAQTLLQGVQWSDGAHDFFCIVDMYIMNGEPILALPMRDKLERMYSTIQSETSPKRVGSGPTIVVGLPLMERNYLALLRAMRETPPSYEMSHVLFHDAHQNAKYTFTTQFFWAHPDKTPDIYHLFTQTYCYVDTALIPDFETSQFMNHLFNIASNHYTEDSDHDDVKKDTGEPKRENIWLEFAYHTRIKKWMPIPRWNAYSSIRSIEL